MSDFESRLESMISETEPNVFDKYSPKQALDRALDAYTRTIELAKEARDDATPGNERLEREILRLANELYSERKAVAEATVARYIDDVTNVLSREAIAREFFDDLKRVSEAQVPQLRIALLDINNLKAVNDFGDHAKGNEYLRVVGDTLRLMAPQGYKPGRIGGDELLVIMPEEDLDIEQQSRTLDFAVNGAVDSYVSAIKSDPKHERLADEIERYPLGVAVGSGSIGTDFYQKHNGTRRSIEDWVAASGAEDRMKQRKEELKQGKSYR